MSAAMWDRAEKVTFEQWRDVERLRDVFKVDKAPEVVIVIETWLESALEYGREMGRYPFRREGDVLRWDLDNCKCRYRVLERDTQRFGIPVLLCERLGSA